MSRGGMQHSPTEGVVSKVGEPCLIRASFEGVVMHAEEAATDIYRRGLRSVRYHWVVLYRSKGFTEFDARKGQTPAEYRAMQVSILHDIHKERCPRTEAQRFIRGMIVHHYAVPNRPKAKTKAKP